MLQDHFRTGLLEETEFFKVEATKLNEKFLLHGPFTSDNSAEGKFVMPVSKCNSIWSVNFLLLLLPALCSTSLLTNIIAAVDKLIQVVSF